MKARIMPTKQIKQAVRDEVKKELNERVKITVRDYGDNFDATVLWVLHSRFGFGKSRLRRFYDEFRDEYIKLKEYYELGDDTPYACKQALKKIGVDIEEWNNERDGINDGISATGEEEV